MKEIIRQELQQAREVMTLFVNNDDNIESIIAPFSNHVLGKNTNTKPHDLPAKIH